MKRFVTLMFVCALSMVFVGGCAGKNKCSGNAALIEMQERIDDITHVSDDMCALALQIQMGGVVKYAGDMTWLRYDGAVGTIPLDEFRKECASILNSYRDEVAATRKLIDEQGHPTDGDDVESD